MYKIWNKLFGWDYVAWENSADHGIARVYKNSFQIYYCRYPLTKVFDEIKSKEQVIWLTCNSDKYFEE